MSIKDLVAGAVKCTLCGSAYGKCDCWAPCWCGWVYERAKGPADCGNPIAHAGRKGGDTVVAAGKLPASLAGATIKKRANKSSARCEYGPEGHGRCALPYGHAGQHEEGDNG